MVFLNSLSDCKFPQVSMTLLGILAVLNNVVFWMVSTRSLISKSPSPFNNPLVTIPKVAITIVTFMFQFFQFPSKIEVLTLIIFFQFYSVVSRDNKVHNSESSLIFVDYCKVGSSVRD